MVDVYDDYGFDKGLLTLDDLQFFKEMAVELASNFDDPQSLISLSEDRRLIIRQLLGEVSRHRSDHTWEW